MYTESAVIVALILFMSYFAMRSEKKEFALSILPLTIVPGFNLLTAPFSALLYPYLSAVHLGRGNLVINMVGLVVACTAFGVLSRHIQTRAGRRLYLFLCLGFSTVLTMIFIFADISVYVFA